MVKIEKSSNTISPTAPIIKHAAIAIKKLITE